PGGVERDAAQAGVSGSRLSEPVADDVAVAREGEVRQGVPGERRDLEHLLPRPRPLAVLQPGPVRDPDHAGGLRFLDVVDAQQLGDLDRRADLLQALAPGRVGRVLVVVDEATGQAPEAVARVDAPATEPDSLAGFD